MEKLIALYKLNKTLEAIVTRILSEHGHQPSCFHSKKTVIDHMMNPFVLITPLTYVNEVHSLSIPVVSLSIHLSDFEKTIEDHDLNDKNPLIMVSEEEKKWLDTENHIRHQNRFEICSREQVHYGYAKKNTSILVSSWEKNLSFLQQSKKHLFFVQPSMDTVISAIRQAIQLIDVTKEMFKEKYQVQAIVDSAHDGLIAVDRQGKITLTNNNAKVFLGLEAEVIGRNITDYIPNSDMLRVLQTGKKEIGDVAKIQDRQFMINRYPVILNNTVVGAVSNFKEITDLQRLEMKLRKKLHENGLEAKYTLNDIVGEAKKICEAKEQAKVFAKTDATVLITGESGTGKELFAQGIHLQSTRAIGPFVAVNCAAFPESLLESELFGYEEGSFTGARKGGKQGLFELAHGGTLFLDEIGEMPLQIQAHLLRVLQERSIRRIGGKRTIPVNVRIIAATNTNIESEIENKRFRNDLYYRLNVLSLDLPPLRTRLADIPLLTRHFIRQFNEQHRKQIEKIDEDFFSLLQEYHWPGNIRELRNVLERIVLLQQDSAISAKDASYYYPKIRINRSDTTAGNATIKEKEKDLIQVALKQYESKAEAAKSLGIDRSTLWRKIKEYKL
ncbi:sigma-54 interaction domain-containing protein [Metabacillus hrfriensis]|uniref:Sigma 54-interacting transcriptional regulator n=1 Tax=Metabacillus hrfriensis TaxID=3048891 RepID=A0ACD4R6N6_9BACI|nr:sigma 54-interacting transcriptional regulator [Metabacillus sp. CT-WN-B3]WHZ56018.1 sigma 54-interacting transcriptional regulator [Metabacillus sp. CT-WN-B3]